MTVFITGQVQGDAESSGGSGHAGGGSDQGYAGSETQDQSPISSRYRVLLSDESDTFGPTHDAPLSGDAEPPTDGKGWLSIPGLLQYLSTAGLADSDIVLFTDNAELALHNLDEVARARVTRLTGREERADGELYDGFAQRLMYQLRRAGEADRGVGSEADWENEEDEAGQGGKESTAVKKYLNRLDGDTARTEYKLARLASRFSPWASWTQQRSDLAPYQDFTRQLDSLLDNSDGTFSEATRETAKRIMSSDTDAEAEEKVR